MVIGLPKGGNMARLTPGGCVDCGVEIMNPGTRGGLQLRCDEHRRAHVKQRHRDAARERYRADREKHAAEARARREADRERYNAQVATRRAADPERHRELARARYRANPEKHRAVRHAYYMANPDRHREVARNSHARRMASNPEAYRAWIRDRAAREREAEGCCTASQWRRILAIYGEWCGKCGSAEDITQDHIVPLRHGGSHWPWNLQPLCRPCNSAKGARDDTDYRWDGGAAIPIPYEPYLLDGPMDWALT